MMIFTTIKMTIFPPKLKDFFPRTAISEIQPSIQLHISSKCWKRNRPIRNYLFKNKLNL